MAEVYGLAVVRVDEALGLRESGVKKPILMMAPASDAEAAELVRQEVRLSPFHDWSKAQIQRLAIRVNRPVPVHLFIDTGMNREGMRWDRALPWIEELGGCRGAKIEGIYTQFSGATRGGVDWDREQLRRLLDLVQQTRSKRIGLGLVHGAPSTQIVCLPESHTLDLVRPGGAIYGLAAYRTDATGDPAMDLRPVFRLRARVVRVDQIHAGEGVGFGHRYVAERATWIALLPVGHTDGYPRNAAGACKVLIRGAVYPVIGTVSSNHTIVEIGEEKRVEVGDVATLIGPDHSDITPAAVAAQTGLDRDYWIMTKLNALLHRRVV